MKSKPTTHRLRHRFGLERYEPRQLLSAVPTADPQVQISGQVLDFQFSNFTISLQSERTLAAASGISFGQPGTATYSVVDGIVSSAVNVVADGTGSVPRDSSYSNNVILNGSNDWSRAPAPNLDPVGSPSPGPSPIARSPGGEPVGGPTPSGPHTSTGVDTSRSTQSSSGSTNSSSSTSSTGSTSPATQTVAVPTTLSGSRPGEDNGPRWLSASFSPAETHRLDTAPEQPGLLANAKVADPRDRLALEPTRVTSQTFCMVSDAALAKPDNFGARVPETAMPPQTKLPAKPSQPQPADEAWSEPAEPDGSHAARDAAILGWQSDHAAGRASRPATAGVLASLVRGAALADDDAEEGEEEAGSWHWAEQLFVEEKQLIGALLAIAAMKSLHSLDRAEAARSSRPPLRVAQRLKPRFAAEC